MFEIHTKQIVSISASKRENEIRDIAAAIEPYYRKSELHNKDILQFTKQTIDEIKNYDIVRTNEIRTYLLLKLRYQELRQVPLSPKIISILTYPDRVFETKAELLIDLLEPEKIE